MIKYFILILLLVGCNQKKQPEIYEYYDYFDIYKTIIHPEYALCIHCKKEISVNSKTAVIENEIYWCNKKCSYFYWKKKESDFNR